MPADFVLNETLPPDGSSDQARSFLVGERDSEETLGILGFYAGYPTESTLYVGALFLRPAWQRRGFGREIMREIEQHAGGADLKEIRLGIDPDNWVALRFWGRLGYDRITKIVNVSGEDANHPPRLELGKAL